MIVTDVGVGTGGVFVCATGQIASWVCLARRGMLHSECEAVEHFRLQPGARLVERHLEPLGDVWFVVRGTGVLDDGRTLDEHALFVRGAGPTPGLTAVTGMEVLTVSVLPDVVADELAPRHPIASPVQVPSPPSPSER